MRMLVLCVLLAGCAAPPDPWASADPKLRAQCQFEAEKGAGPPTDGSLAAGVDRVIHRNKLMALCMKAKS